jgi:hypothetical protein
MRVLFFLLCSAFVKVGLNGQIIINEVNISVNWVELYNAGTTTVDISSYFLCNRPRYDVISGSGVTIISGSLSMAPGNFTVLQWDDIDAFTTRGEVGLYMNGSFGDPNSIKDYMHWGSATGGRASTAVAAGVWDNASIIIPAPTNSSNSIALQIGEYMDGTDTNSTDWVERAPTQGAVNNISNQIIINEVNLAGNWVELYNSGTTTIDISAYTLCNRPRYRVVTGSTASGSNAGVQFISGSFIMAPGDFTVLQWKDISEYGPTDGELGLYEVFGSFNSTTNIQDYLQWGMGSLFTAGGRDQTAENAGVWDSTNSFLPVPTDPNNSLGLTPSNYMGGTDTDSMDWEEQSPTQGATNMSPSDCPIDEDITGVIPSDTYYASNSITSDGIVVAGENVAFVAGDNIMLNGGFTVELNAVFEANIGSCP